MAHVTRPVWIHTFREDLIDVFVSIFVYFLGSLILWPLIIVISFLFIPVTLLCRLLLLSCSIPCTCSRSYFKCICRQFATAVESSWIDNDDRVLTFTEYRAKLRISGEQLSSQCNTDGEVVIHNDAHELEVLYPKSTFAKPKLVGKTHTVVIVLDESLQVEKLVSLLNTRVVSLLTAAGTKYFPRFTQCLVQTISGVLVWVDDPVFILSNHIEIRSEHVNDQKELEKLLELKSREGLPSDRPLWQLIIIPSYTSNKSVVLIWKFHAALYDGVTISKILTYAFGNPKLTTYKAGSQYYEFANHIARYLIIGPIRFIYLLVRRSPKNKQRASDKDDEILAHHSWSERTLNLPVILKNKMMLNICFNDMLLSMLVGALRDDYPSSRPTNPETHIRSVVNCSKILIPYDMWVSHKKSDILPQGNRLIMMPLTSNFTQEVIPRLWLTEYTFSKLKKYGDTQVQLLSMQWLHLLPLPKYLLQRINSTLQSDCETLVTSMTGPNAIESIDGAQVLDIMYFMYPPNGVAHSFNFISYSGTVKMMALSSNSVINTDVVDQIVSNMVAQLATINKMIFMRYFPDGINQSLSLVSHPHTSRLYIEFIKKLRDIECSQSTASPTDTPTDTPTAVATPTDMPPATVATNTTNSSASGSNALVHCEVDGKSPAIPNTNSTQTHGSNPTDGSNTTDDSTPVGETDPVIENSDEHAVEVDVAAPGTSSTHSNVTNTSGELSFSADAIETRHVSDTVNTGNESQRADMESTHTTVALNENSDTEDIILSIDNHSQIDTDGSPKSKILSQSMNGF